MKKIICLFLGLSVCLTNYAQDFPTILGNWNGGEAFDGEYADSILLFQFDSVDFHFQYGPNHYPEYKTYRINGDTLMLMKNDGFQEAAFILEKLDETTLELQAINWTAVYVTNTLCSPWTNTDPPNIPLDADYDTQGVLTNDVVQTKLTFELIPDE